LDWVLGAATVWNQQSTINNQQSTINNQKSKIKNQKSRTVWRRRERPFVLACPDQVLDAPRHLRRNG
jgi:hypothetical protein